MKKMFIVIALLSISSATGFSQSTGSWLSSERHQQHLKKISAILQSGHVAAEARPTETRERVIAQTMMDGGFIDSTTYSYSGTRGSRYDFNNPELLYNTDLSSEYAPIPVYGLEGYNPLNMLADTIRAYDNEGLYYSVSGIYRSDNKLDTIVIDGEGVLVNVYDANGYLIEQSGFSIDGTGTLTPAGYQRRLQYNPNYTKVTGDSIFMENLLDRYTRYVYGSDDLVDSILVYSDNGTAMELRMMFVMGHDAEGRIINSRLEEYYGGSGYGTLDSFSYSGSSSIFESWISYYYEDPDTLLEKNQMRRVLNTDGLTDTLYVHYTDLIDNEQDSVFATYVSYTSLNNPEEIKIFFDGFPETSFRFYYETYDDGVGIEEKRTDLALEVYPNPFTDELYLSLNSENSTGPVAIRLMDLQGREVYNSTAKMQNGSYKLQLPELSGGIYQLLLQDASGKTATKKLVKIK